MNEMLISYQYRKSDGEIINICKHQCHSYAEFIKMLDFCKKNEVPFYIRDDDEKVNKEAIEFCNWELYVESFDISFGSDDSIQQIEVVLF